MFALLYSHLGFWCDGSGTRKIDGKVCKVCQGNTFYQCSQCSNSGKVECQDCNQGGIIQMSYFVDVILRSVELPAIPVSLLFDEEDGPPTSEAVRSMAVEKVLQATKKLCSEKSTKATPVAAVVARTVWERSLLCTYSVHKPLKSKWKALGEDSLSENGELDADTVFTGLSDTTEVQSHYFTMSSDPQCAPCEAASRSRAGSRVNSRANSRTNSPAVSPRTSVADLRSALKSSTSAPNFYSGSLGRKSSIAGLPSSTSAPGGFGISSSPPKMKPRKSFTNLFSRSGSMTSLSPAPSSYELQSAVSNGKRRSNVSAPASPPERRGSMFAEVINEEIADLPPRIETPVFSR